MIKAKGTMPNGAPLYLFGLSHMNLEKLREGLPMKIDLATMDGVGQIIICYGSTEDSLLKTLQEFIGPDTQVDGFNEH